MDNETQYLKLTDTEHKGEIVKRVGRKFYGFIGGNWERRGISIGYFDPDAPEFECYETITEKEAKETLGI